MSVSSRLVLVSPKHEAETIALLVVFGKILRSVQFWNEKVRLGVN